MLDLVWSQLLPALGDRPLPQDVQAQSLLADQLANLTLPPLQGEATSPLAAAVAGQRYDFTGDANQSMLRYATLDFQADHAVLVAQGDAGEQRLQCGYGEWLPSTTAFGVPEKMPGLSRGAWTAPDLFTLEIRYIQTPHCLTLHFQFDEERLRVSGRWNVMFGEVALPEMVGRIEV